jgi:tetratricopeptide (TPR) repeat protein
MALGQQELALSEARRARELAPGWPNTRFVVGMLLYHAGRYEEAVMELRELSIPWVEMGAETHLALSYAALGKETEARAVQQIVEASDDIYAKASLRAALDGLDAGYAALADLQDWSDWPTLDFRNLGRPLWDPQGADPRYAEILHAIDASWGREE